MAELFMKVTSLSNLCLPTKIKVRFDFIYKLIGVIVRKDIITF